MNVNKGRLIVGLVFSVAGLLFPAVSAAVTETAPAVSQTVFERVLNDEELGAHFDVNRDLGRAWIDVTLTPENSEIGVAQVVRRAVDGLYYDPAQKQVVYRDGAKRIVCAEDSSFLGLTSLKNTGQCELRVSSESRKIDDGFRVEEETVSKVVFEARNPAQ